MPVCRIRQLGDPTLREVSRAIEPTAAEPILADLRDTLHQFQRDHGFGRGISAVQIGHLVRAIYLEFEGRSYSLLNPRYLSRSEEVFTLWDDCFSFPHLMVEVARHCMVEVEYQDELGARQVLQAAGPLSELLQHEMDHLDGILTVDRALSSRSFRTRMEHLRQLELLRQTT